ncbi:hypothetical protein ILT44_23270 [Microvirga sp. BT689]|uniref:hypothetical protein n=1 Tax=Microvirga arvi TaxID=2778731 RepID=UPI00194FA48D|nr:hypothetical protein [Microvirga arvi]MBM6583126.1 hypothetical protein [Microvirga arvi]
MSWDKAEQVNIAAKEMRQAADEPTLEPSFDPLVNMTHAAAKEDHDLEDLGPMSPGHGREDQAGAKQQDVILKIPAISMGRVSFRPHRYYACDAPRFANR